MKTLRLSAAALLVAFSAACGGTEPTTEATLSSDASLRGLTAAGVTLSPVFNATTTEYSGAVGNSLTSVRLTATATHPGAKITINNSPAVSGAQTPQLPIAVGVNTYTVLVTAENGLNTRSYVITITRAAGTPPA